MDLGAIILVYKRRWLGRNIFLGGSQLFVQLSKIMIASLHTSLSDCALCFRGNCVRHRQRAPAHAAFDTHPALHHCVQHLCPYAIIQRDKRAEDPRRARRIPWHFH